ncbi:two-component regulator propeller domain-containing protein [Flavobacterium hankyongi]|uniref:Two-component regulator propeller domain-containing protein n=2 Tax=Flavobacteriaceae TaxID=49546 RepID=A0ABP8ZMF0_9FLAO
MISQQNSVWKGYFSYNSIKDISQSTTTFYGAAENAYFKRNVATNEISTTSTIEGLSGQTITQIYYSEAYKKTIIGHVDGLLVVVNEKDGSMLNVVDIVNKPSVPPNMKKVNHINEYNGKLYIATDFGICVFDLATSEFGDTYFIGSNGSNIQILQTAVSNNTIYAVANGYGLLSASVNNPNLVDYNQWTMTASGNWASVTTTATDVALINLSGQLYKLVGNSPVYLTALNQMSLDARFSESNYVVTTQNYVYVFDSQLNEIFRINNSADSTTHFTCATVLSDKVYIGTQERGVITTTQTNTTAFQNISPNGPDRNRIFAVKSFSNGVWAVYGDHTIYYNPHPLDALSVSRFEEKVGWVSTPYSSLFGAKSIVRIETHPNDEKKVFFSSYHSGLLKFDNNLPSTLYDATNSSLQAYLPLQPTENIRVNGLGFDKSNNLWVTNSLATNPINVLRSNGQWQGYSLSVLQNPAVVSYGRIAVDKNNTKWICSNSAGIIGFNENYNNRCLRMTEGSDSGNLPTSDVRAVAVDNKNKLWIGTAYGLRVLSSVDSFLTQDKLTANSIIILEDGLAQELLYNQFITDIVVDGANNKWIGTAGAGVFYISDDGQKTFNIFTKENSPLPNNTINDIEINKVTGEVFIATESGMVSFRGSATSGTDDLENVVVFPNPVRPEFGGNVAVSGLMDKANVKITDIEGNLVFEAISEGGTVLWDTRNFRGSKVASGVYMVLISAESGEKTKVKKVMIVR